MTSLRFQSKPFSITVIQVYVPITSAEESEFDQFYEDIQEFLELIPKKDIVFITGDQNEKVGSQEIPGIKGKSGLGVQNEAGQRLIEFYQESTLVVVNTLFHNTRDDFKHGHQQMVNTGIRLITFFVAKDGEAVYSQHKYDLELTVAQVIHLLQQNSGLN